MERVKVDYCKQRRKSTKEQYEKQVCHNLSERQRETHARHYLALPSDERDCSFAARVGILHWEEP